VPLDRSWGANLPSVWEFPVLAHELVYYLADTRSAEHNLAPGQPLRYRPQPLATRVEDAAKQPTLLLLSPPEGEPKLFRYAPEQTAEPAASPKKPPLEIFWDEPGGLPRRLKVEPTPLQHENLRDTGVYRIRPGYLRVGQAGEPRLHLIEEATAYYVVQPDRRESDLTPASEEDRKTVASFVPMEYQNEQRPVVAAMVASSQTQDVWWWFMIGVILLLCGEVWMTRRMVKGRETAA
jgi:hypothetical protein